MGRRKNKIGRPKKWEMGETFFCFRVQPIYRLDKKNKLEISFVGKSAKKRRNSPASNLRPRFWKPRRIIVKNVFKIVLQIYSNWNNTIGKTDMGNSNSFKYKAEWNGFKKHFATFKVCGKGCKKTKHVSVLADAK
jgi:hypothetical protein